MRALSPELARAFLAELASLQYVQIWRWQIYPRQM